VSWRYPKSELEVPETHLGLPFLGGRRFLVLHLVWIVPEELLGLQLVGGSNFFIPLLRGYFCGRESNFIY